MRPVDTAVNAKFVVIISDRRYKSVVDKFYFETTDNDDLLESSYCVRWVCNNFPEYVTPLNSISINLVVNGREVAAE